MDPSQIVQQLFQFDPTRSLTVGTQNAVSAIGAGVNIANANERGRANRVNEFQGQQRIDNQDRQFNQTLEQRDSHFNQTQALARDRFNQSVANDNHSQFIRQQGLQIDQANAATRQSLDRARISEIQAGINQQNAELQETEFLNNVINGNSSNEEIAAAIENGFGAAPASTPSQQQSTTPQIGGSTPSGSGAVSADLFPGPPQSQATPQIGGSGSVNTDVPLGGIGRSEAERAITPERAATIPSTMTQAENPFDAAGNHRPDFVNEPDRTGTTDYVVQPHDTQNSIAANFAVDPRDIPRTVTPGQTIQLPIVIGPSSTTVGEPIPPQSSGPSRPDFSVFDEGANQAITGPQPSPQPNLGSSQADFERFQSFDFTDDYIQLKQIEPMAIRKGGNTLKAFNARLTQLENNPQNRRAANQLRVNEQLNRLSAFDGRVTPFYQVQIDRLKQGQPLTDDEIKSFNDPDIMRSEAISSFTPSPTTTINPAVTPSQSGPTERTPPPRRTLNEEAAGSNPLIGIIDDALGF